MKRSELFAKCLHSGKFLALKYIRAKFNSYRVPYSTTERHEGMHAQETNPNGELYELAGTISYLRIHFLVNATMFNNVYPVFRFTRNPTDLEAIQKSHFSSQLIIESKFH
jgi:hypothetical protein